MKNTLETRLGIFFALALVVAAIVLQLIGAADIFKKGYPINAVFNNVQELKRGDLIKMAGVEIGRVTDIRLENAKASVSMKINDGVVIKTDSRAVIKFTGLMGANFISIDGGTAEASTVLPGTTMDSAEQPSLSTLMAKLEGVASGVEGLTKSFSPDNFSTMFGPITDFIKQNSGQLSTIVSNISTASSDIAEGRGTVGALIKTREFYNAALGAVTNFQAASGQISGLIDQANAMVGDAKAIVAQVKSGQGTLGKLTMEDTLYKETTEAMTNLREIMQKINSGQGTVGMLVNDESFFKNAKLTLQKVEKATEGLEDQGPLSVIGIAINPLF